MGPPRSLRRVMCLEDFAGPARSFLPAALWEFVSTGADGKVSLRGNRASFDRYWLKTRILTDVSGRSTAKQLLGSKYGAPFGIAPMGASALFGFEADLAFARAAARANIPFLMSGSALIPMEKIAEANPDAWFQAYVIHERDAIAALADRAWNAGFRTLVVTVDTPVGANRRVNLRQGFNYPMRPTLKIAVDGLLHPRWLFGTFFRTLMTTGMPHIENYGAGRGMPVLSWSAPDRRMPRDALDWEDMKWLRGHWNGRLLLKGVLAAEDARTAAGMGLDGIMVSNHGGRFLDTSIPPLKVLPEIAAEKGGMAIIYDGGVRRGTDVVKALGLGADFVFIGRPFLHAAAIAEEAGVAHAIELLAAEIDRTMAFLGCADLDGHRLGARIVPEDSPWP